MPEFNGIKFTVRTLNTADAFESQVNHYIKVVRKNHPNMMRGWLYDIASEGSKWTNPGRILACREAAVRLGVEFPDLKELAEELIPLES